MTARQGRVDIGQAAGNTLSASINWVKGNPLYEKMNEKKQTEKINEIWAKLFIASRELVDTTYNEWWALNEPILREELGLPENYIPKKVGNKEVEKANTEFQTNYNKDSKTQEEGEKLNF